MQYFLGNDALSVWIIIRKFFSISETFIWNQEQKLIVSFIAKLLTFFPQVLYYSKIYRNLFQICIIHQIYLIFNHSDGENGGEDTDDSEESSLIKNIGANDAKTVCKKLTVNELLQNAKLNTNLKV